jgi:hypothetical protein
MTKVEELRGKLNTAISTAVENGSYTDAMAIDPILDALLAAAEAQGVEGERGRINRECVGPVYDGSKVITTMPNRPFYLVPVDIVAPSVLTPKEKP